MGAEYDIDDDLPQSERTLPALWQRRAKIRPSEPFLWFSGRASRTAEELDRDVMRAIGALDRLGVKKAERVCVFMKNSPEMLCAMLALWHLGAVVVPLGVQMVGALLADQVRRARPLFVLADDDLVGGVAVANAPVVELGRLLAEAATHAPGSPGAAVSNVSFVDPALVLYTSGSTGPSKGCVLSHHFCVYYGWVFWRHMGYRNDDTIYSCLPLNHVHALFASFLPAVLAGAQFSFAERFAASRYWHDIADSMATACSAIGPMASILINQPVSEVEGRLRVRLAHIAPAPPRVEEFQRRFRLRVASVLYGMTEAMIFPPDPQFEPVAGIIGAAPRDWEVAIVDDLGHRLPAGEPGELVARPRRPLILFDRYFEMPEETVNAWRGLWYHTGDVCRQDANGVFWFLGRKRDVIRRRGQNVSTWELETLVGNHPDISEAAALAVPGEDDEDAITLYVRRVEGSSLDQESLKKYCESMLPRFMRPDHLRIEDAELPRTPSGKIDKPRLKQIFAARAGANDR